MQGGHHVKNILNFERMFAEGVLLISLAGGRGGNGAFSGTTHSFKATLFVEC